MELDADIVIVGGGLNGPALALALAQGGQEVVIIDALPPETRRRTGFDGRSYSLALGSTRVLEGIGVWGAVQPHAQPILSIRACDGRAGEGAAPLFLEFDHAEIEEGPMGHMIEDRYLRAALMDAIEAEGRITEISGARVVAQEIGRRGPAIRLDDGRVLHGRLLVGCDGRGSGTAERAGIRRVGWDYGQSALVCAVTHERPHDGCAHQFFTPQGPLAILPLPGNRSSIVWTEGTEAATRIARLDDDAYLEVLRPRFGEFLGEIALAGARHSYPLRLSLAERFVGQQLALVGDAAHGIHPIAGQGLNLGMRDVAALAEVVIEAARRGEDIASAPVLERYQRWRRFDTMLMAMGTDGVNRLFSNDSVGLRVLRDLGMGAISRLPALRRGFIREAAGLSGELPRLMQGRPI